MNSGIILMAGAGERSALSYNKTLYEYMNKPLFMYSTEAFLKNELINEIILVINPDFMFFENILKNFFIGFINIFCLFLS